MGIAWIQHQGMVRHGVCYKSAWAYVAIASVLEFVLAVRVGCWCVVCVVMVCGWNWGGVGG